MSNLDSLGFVSVPSELEVSSMGYGVFRRTFHDTLLRLLAKSRYWLAKDEADWSIFSIDMVLAHNEMLSFVWEDDTPDLASRSNGKLKILEVTITHNHDLAVNSKNLKYRRIIESKEKLISNIEFSLFVWDGNPDDFEDSEGRDLLLGLWHLNETMISLGYRSEDYHYPDELRKLQAPGSFFSKRSLPEPIDNTSDISDDEYLELLADSIVKDVKENKKHRAPRLSSRPDLYELFLEKWLSAKFMRESNSEVKRVLQLGCPSVLLEELPFDGVDVTDTFDAVGYAGKVSTFDRGPLVLSLSQQEKLAQMEEGPGRKQLYKLTEKVRGAPTHIGIDSSHLSQVDDFLMRYFTGNPESHDNLLYQCLRFYQRISTEIIMNSMHRRRRSQYQLCSAGFRGVWVLIHPGPPLRTESNTIWVKIISKHPGIIDPLSQSWSSVGSHYESKWLSVDTERLKHWSRCHDRLQLTYRTLASQLISMSVTSKEAYKQECLNGSFGLQALIFLENKLSTSQSIECTRYFFMRSTGDGGVHELVSKLPERVSTILQSYVYQRLAMFVKETLNCDLRSVLKMENRSELKSEASVLGSLPRIFTPGGRVPLNYLINEMYMGCYYNPNRQNKTQDAFKILSKILIEEDKLDDELSMRSEFEQSQHLMGFHSVESDIEHCLKEKYESHYYSAKAVKIGIKEQARIHPTNIPLSFGRVLSKRLSSFATFKASVWEIRESFEKDRDDCHKDLGKRSKCLALVDELAKLGNYTVKDILIRELKNDGMLKICIQIFKKNQWGGVREILILQIVARILINILETISREICENDPREMLTEGRNKQIFMKKDHDELLTEFEKNDKLLLIKHSDDMTRWCQKFIPLIFRFQFDCETRPEITQLSLRLLFDHCNKIIEFPKELVRMWEKYPDLKHNSELDKVKELFKVNKTTSMVNTSNMGQGILHFSSSVLALGCDSFKDLLFNRIRSKLALSKALAHRVRLSSDDKGEIICLNRDDPSAGFQYVLYTTCSEWARRLFSMALSVKAASNYFIYEFNSTFMVNANCVSALIKFSLAACDLIRTDSFTESVQESFSRIRQFHENGATLDLVDLAHSLNARYLENVFGTSPKSQNSPEILFQQDRSYFPYDLGVYPRMLPELSVVFGPEYYNWLISKTDAGAVNCKRIYKTTEISEVSEFVDNPEEYFRNSSFYKREPIRIPQGFVSQLQSLKKKVGFNFDILKEKLSRDYLFLLRDEQSPDETEWKVFLKLCGRSARLAVKRTSEAIYLGRSGAFRTAKAWTLDSAKDEKMTYSEFVQQLSPSDIDIDKCFPLSDVYSSASPSVPRQRIKRPHLYLKPTTLTINRQIFDGSDNFKDLFLSTIGLAESDDYTLRKFREVISADWKNAEEFEKTARSMHYEPYEYMMYCLSVFESRKTSQMKCLSACINTKTISDTLNTLSKHMRDADYIWTTDNPYDVKYLEADIYTWTDKVILDRLGWLKLTEDERRDMKILLESNNFRGKISRLFEKCLIITAMSCMNQTEAIQYMQAQGLTIKWYIKKQQKCNGEYRGDLVYACVGRGSEFLIRETKGMRYMEISKINPRNFLGMLKMALRDLGWTIDDVTIERKHMLSGDYYIDRKHLRYVDSDVLKAGYVLNLKYSSLRPKVPTLDFISFKINEKNQFEIWSGDVCLVNYALKFCTSLENLRDQITINQPEDIVKLIQEFSSAQENRDDDDLEDFDFTMEEFMADLRDDSGIEFSNIIEAPMEVIDSGDFTELDLTDFKESLQYEVKRNESIRFELIELLFLKHPEDNPRNLPPASILEICNWIFLQKINDPEYNWFRDWCFTFYCSFLGVNESRLYELLDQYETNSRPISLLSKKPVFHSHKILKLLKESSD